MGRHTRTELINRNTFVMANGSKVVISQKREKKPYVSVIFLDYMDVLRIKELMRK